MKKKPLTPKKLEWAKNRTVTLKGAPLNHNAALMARYRREILKLVRTMAAATKREITALFDSRVATAFLEQQAEAEAMDAAPTITSKAKQSIAKLQDRFTDLFRIKSAKLADEMLGDVDTTSARQLGSSLKELSGGLTLNTSIVPPGMAAESNAIIAENVSLITSIPQQYFTGISGAVMRSITTGNGLNDLIPAIQKIDGVTERRATNIARDQTRKAYNMINKQRMVAIGVKQFRWLHSQGQGHPRQSHLKILNGRVFSFENIIAEQIALGVTDPYDQGLPSISANCGCRFIPVLNFGE